MPLVSIIIPTFNRCELLRETLASVLVQSFSDFEVIVADDGSTDDTSEMVSQIPDRRVRFVTEENQSHEGVARNLGLRASKAEYVAFLDSDDLWTRDKLEKQTRVLLARPEVGLVYCDAYLFDSDTRLIRSRYHQQFKPYEGRAGERLLVRDFIPCPTPLIRRSVLDAVGFFSTDPLLRMRADWDLWLRIAAHYPIAYVGEPLAFYRLHALNSCHKEDPLRAHRSRLKVIENAVRFAPELYHAVQKEAEAELCLDSARALLLRGSMAQARDVLTDSSGCSGRYLERCVLRTISYCPRGTLQLMNRVRQAAKTLLARGGPAGMRAPRADLPARPAD